MGRRPAPFEPPRNPVIRALSERRESLGLTWTQLAERSGYDAQQFADWERERKIPQLRSVLDWAQALNTTLVLESASGE